MYSYGASKPIRAISIDYESLTTPAVIAEATLALVKALIRVHHRHPTPERQLLDRYKAYLERLIQANVSKATLPNGLTVEYADEEEISRGLGRFKREVGEADCGVLTGILRSNEAKDLKVDISDIIIAYQRNFIEMIRADNNKYDDEEGTIVFVGPMRQSKAIDEFFAYNEDLLYKGSAFQVMPKFARSFGAEYDPLILERILPEEYRDVVDRKGVAVLYAQANKVAIEKPDYGIVFQFYSSEALEVFSSPESGLAAVVGSCPDFFPKAVTVELYPFDASLRNADPKMIAGGRLSLANENGVTDRHYRQTVIEWVKKSPQFRGNIVPNALWLSIGHTPNRDLEPEQLKQIIYERRAYELILTGRADILEEAILQVFSAYLRASSAIEGIMAKERYGDLDYLFQLLSNKELSNEAKVAELKAFSEKKPSLKLKLEELYAAIPSAKKRLITPDRGHEASAGGAGGSAGASSGGAAVGGAGGGEAAVFARAAGAATGLQTRSFDAEKVMKILTYIIPRIIRQQIISQSYLPESIQLNNKQYPVPKGIRRIFNIAISEEAASNKMREINAVFAEKGRKAPYGELQDLISDPVAVSLTREVAAPAHP